MKFKQWDIIEISWVDSSHSGGWTDEKEAQKHVDEISLSCVSAGYFFRERKDAVTIVQSRSFLENDFKSVDAQMTIPKVSIHKIRRLKWAK